MTDTIPWATRYLMALESEELHNYSYDYGESRPLLRANDAEEQHAGEEPGSSKPGQLFAVFRTFFFPWSTTGSGKRC
jgi:hypothetical protein